MEDRPSYFQGNESLVRGSLFCFYLETNYKLMLSLWHAELKKSWFSYKWASAMLAVQNVAYAQVLSLFSFLFWLMEIITYPWWIGSERYILAFLEHAWRFSKLAFILHKAEGKLCSITRLVTVSPGKITSIDGNNALGFAGSKNTLHEW